MYTAQSHTLYALENAATFLDDKAAVLGDAIADPRAMLLASIAELTDHRETQNGQTRAILRAIGRRKESRAALIRDHMIPIARIAALQLHDKPEFAGFSMPKSRPTTERLAALADGLAQAVGPYTDVFIRSGLRPDFVQALRTATSDMVQALKDRAQSRGQVKSATSALRDKLTRARKVVGVLDAFVKSALVDRPELIDEWNTMKRARTPRNGASSAVAAPVSPAADIAAAA